ncbi:MAG: OmpA family protein [Prevotellaceae bacterium]|nr:OmpA family protein [Prevotellaceae bacterium]
MKKITLVLAVGLSLLAASCVSQKKFQDLEAEKAISDNKSTQLEVELEDMRAKNEAEQSRNANLSERIFKIQDTIQQLRYDQRQMAARYEELQSTQDALQKGSQKEIRNLLEQLQKHQEQMQRKEDELFSLERALNDKAIATNKMEVQLRENNQKLIALENALHQKDSMANDLRQKLSAALLNFEGNGLTVKIRNGKVYVSMEDKLMFASGSANVDKRGAEALKKITEVLEKNPDINVVIEGHTDDVPYRGTSQIIDNWDLSCKRATAVVRLLLKGSTIEESRITAAGRSEYLPVRKGNTPEARQANRRIEVILSPKLDEVLKLLQ